MCYTVFVPPNTLPWWLMFWPIFLFGRISFLMYESCQALECMNWDRAAANAEMPQLIALLVIETFVFLILAV
jgi:hypothetical protein